MLASCTFSDAYEAPLRLQVRDLTAFDDEWPSCEGPFSEPLLVRGADRQFSGQDQPAAGRPVGQVAGFDVPGDVHWSSLWSGPEGDVSTTTHQVLANYS